ncbi:MAG: LON peptidase substrate-binding domain-containing protein [Alphaproteobacteria bacterium]|nr:LON peptidase substrate-binding domain-containing protein [Alphaproteobacteria bacterium]
MSIPKILPVFPLSGVIVPPGAILPFQIFEPRYLSMMEAVLKNGRYLLMAQPKHETNEVNSQQDLIAGKGLPRDRARRGVAALASRDKPELFSVGSLGRVVFFDEDSPSRYRITIMGLQRVRLLDEQAMRRGYRRFRFDRKPFFDDLLNDHFRLPDRDKFIALLARYLKRFEKMIDWQDFKKLEDEKILLVVMITFPFRPAEKQALLEVETIQQRYELLRALLEMNLKDQQFSGKDFFERGDEHTILQ